MCSFARRHDYPLSSGTSSDKDSDDETGDAVGLKQLAGAAKDLQKAVLPATPANPPPAPGLRHAGP